MTKVPAKKKTPATKTKSVDYGSMDSAERANALFTACEEARKTGGHDAAKAVWNAWAEPLVNEREWLIANGEWKVSRGYIEILGMLGEVGNNDVTTDFFRRAEINARDFVFIANNYQGNNKDRGEEELDIVDSETIEIIHCEDINLAGFGFPGIADFSRVSFFGNADFSRTTFKGAAPFKNAVFKGVASFSSSVFMSYVDFNSATFKDIASFNSAIFKDYGDFSSATFKGVADFNSATFKGIADFEQVNFESHARFADVKFHSGSDFTAVHSERAFDLSGAKFFNQVPRFIQAHFTESPRLDHIQLPVPGYYSGRLPSPNGVKRGWQADKDDIAAYTALRRLSLSAQDHSTERLAFKGEMRTKRSLSGFSFYRLFSYIYDALTDFGVSIVRPLVVWLGLFVVVAFVYFQSAIPYQTVANHQRPEICRTSSNIVSASLLSAHNALPFVTSGQRRFIDRAYICLYGSGTDITSAKSLSLPTNLGLWGALHTVISTILVFFILLGMRNRFRIR